MLAALTFFLLGFPRRRAMLYVSATRGARIQGYVMDDSRIHDGRRFEGFVA